MKKTILSLIILCLTGPVSATIESVGSAKIPYSHPQAGVGLEYLIDNWGQYKWATQQYCMADMMYYDYYSSSALPSYELIVEPYHVPSIPKEDGPKQINQLADGKLKIITDWEKFNQYVALNPDQGWSSPTVHEPEFIIDVSAYDLSTKKGRLEALMRAKLAIITIHFNLAQYNGLFRVKIEVKGLPEDQSEFVNNDFSPVYATTQYPYSGPSPLAQKYYSELLSPEFCSDDVEKAKSFAQ